MLDAARSGSECDGVSLSTPDTDASDATATAGQPWARRPGATCSLRTAHCASAENFARGALRDEEAKRRMCRSMQAGDHVKVITRKATLPDEARPVAAGARPERLPLWIVFAMGVVELAVLVVEETAIARRGELTMDYQVFARAYWFIGHGHLAPSVYIPGTGHDLPYLANHFELITWPLALLLVGAMKLPIHVALLDVLQAAPTAAITVLAGLWGARVAERRGLNGVSRWVVVLAPAALSLIDIWQYRAAAFDFHYQALQGALFVGSLYAFDRRATRTAWSLAMLLALTGDTSGLPLAIVAVYLLARRRWRAAGAGLLLAAAALWIPSVLHDNVGSSGALRNVAQLGGESQVSLSGVAVNLIAHPGRAMSVIRGNALGIWGIIGGAGILGAFTDVGLLAILFVGVPSWLSGPSFAYPGDFQTVPLSAALFVGAGSLLGWCLIRRRLAALVGVVSVALAGAWTVVFTPGLIASVATVSNERVGRSLSWIETHIPPNAEVVSPNASLGAVGVRSAQVISDGCPPFSLPLTGRPIAFVVAPWRGTHSCDPAQLLTSLTDIGRLPGAKIVGPLPGRVYWIEWTPPSGQRVLRVSASSSVSAQFLAAEPFASGRLESTRNGPALVSRRHGGFVVEGIVAGVQARHDGYAQLRIGVSGGAEVQIWDDQSGELVAERNMTGSGTVQTERVGFVAPRFVHPKNFTDGSGIFVTKLLPPSPVDPMEVRVWTEPGSGSNAELYSVSVHQGRP